MNTHARRGLAAATTIAAVAATFAAMPTAVAGHAHGTSTARSALAGYGFKGTAEGAKLYVNNVQVLTTKDAVAPLRCTRKIGRASTANSILSAPENSLITLSGSTSKTVTYRDGQQVGTRAINTLGDIQVGDAGGSTPLVTIKGLTTTADAFHNAKGYGHAEHITKMELNILNLPDQVSQPLQDLLDAIQTGALQPVLDVLDTTLANGPIDIPGLGSIGEGTMKGSATGHRAESDAAALVLTVTATGETQKLMLGHARAVTGGPAPAGVFRSTSMPMDIKAADGSLHLGGVHPRTIPCEGTHGRTVTKHLDSASAVLPQDTVAGVTGIDYVYSGTQHRNGTAEGSDASRIGSFDIQALQLSVTGIASQVKTWTTKPGGKVHVKPSFDIAKIVYQGNEIAIPQPGHSKTVDGLGILQTRVVEANKWGARVTALRIQLSQPGLDGTVIDLGIAASQIFAY